MVTGPGTAEWNSLMCPVNDENKNRKWCFIFKELKDIIVCYNKTITSTSGLWRAENPLTYTLPEFILQLLLILLFNRLLMLIFKPLHLSRISAEILVSTPSCNRETKIWESYVAFIHFLLILLALILRSNT